LQVFGVAIWPFVLMVLTYVSYQIVLKFTRPDVNVLGVLTLAYFVACACAATLWFRNQGLGANRLEGRDLLVAVLLGASIVGIEYGFVSAFRLGWPINSTGAIVNVATAVLLVPVGFFVFSEQMSAVNLAGLALCCVGLVLLTLR
jgi:multidrug transporter EmrE-like cation transporter